MNFSSTSMEKHQETTFDETSDNSEEDLIECLHQEFQIYMKKKLPSQVALYLIACGFDCEDAFLSFDTSSGINSESLSSVVDLMRNNSDVLKTTMKPQLFKNMYGLFYTKPESFTILPGHVTQIVQFATNVKTSKLTIQEPKRKKPSPINLNRIVFKEGAAMVSEYETKCDDQNGNNSIQLSSRLSLNDMPELLSQLKATILKYFSSNREYADLSIEEGNQYSVHMSPSLIMATDNSINFESLSASVSCHLCGTKVKLPVVRSKFRPANFYRHIKSCFLNKSRKGNTLKRRRSKVTSFVLLNPMRSMHAQIMDTESDALNKASSSSAGPRIRIIEPNNTVAVVTNRPNTQGQKYLEHNYGKDKVINTVHKGN